MATPYLQVSRDASRALEEFSNEFSSALVLGAFEAWAGMFGLTRTSSAIKTTWPIPISAAGYHEFKGDHKYRHLYHRSLSMTTKQWQDGVEEFARVIEAPDFIDWAGEPGRIATEWLRQPQVLVADMLALSSLDGPLLDFYRDADSDTASTRRLFAADHPYNVLDPDLGDFDNTLDTTVAEIQSGAFFDAANDHFSSILGPNGKPLGLRMTGGNCLVPATRENLFKNTLQFDTIVRTVNNVGTIGATSNVVAGVPQNNIYKGTVGYTRADELADQDHFYALAAGRPGLYPWIVQTAGAPEEFLFDKSSERYKNTLKVAVSYVGDMAAAACLPHGILRVRITG
jgi:hypothetical protein